MNKFINLVLGNSLRGETVGIIFPQTWQRTHWKVNRKLRFRSNVTTFFSWYDWKSETKSNENYTLLRFSAGAVFYFDNCKAMAGQRTKNKISSIYLHPAKLLQRCRNIYHRKAVFVLESLHIYSLVVKLLQPLRLRKYFSSRRWISKIDLQFSRKVAAKKANSSRTNRLSKVRTAVQNFKIAPLKNRENG